MPKNTSDLGNGNNRDSGRASNDYSLSSPEIRTGVASELPAYSLRRYMDEDCVRLHHVDSGDSWRDYLYGRQYIERRDVQFYMHWLNLNLREQYPLTKKRFIELDLETKSWDLEHPQSPYFFHNNQRAILFVEEREVVNSSTDRGLTWYAQHREILCERLAAYSTMADTIGKFVVGSLANLSIMCSYKGDQPVNRIGSSFRLNVINRRCNAFNSYVLPKGACEYVVSHSHRLTATSPTGAPMYSYPLWITDIWGNRGDHEWDWKSYLNETVDDTPTATHRGRTIAVDSTVDNGTWIDSTQRNLLDNVAGVAERYGYGQAIYRMTNSSGDPSLVAGMPRIENGTAYTYKKDDQTFRIPSNYDCNMRGVLTDANYDKPASRTSWSFLTNLTDKLWRNWRYWSSLYTDMCKELITPESELSKFFIAKGWFEPAMPLHDLWKGIQDLPFGSMATHAQNMVYRDHSKPSTTTIVKVDLPVSTDTYTKEGHTYVADARVYGQENPDYNENWLQRFKLSAHVQEGLEIALAMQYPSLTPTVLYHSDYYADSQKPRTGQQEDDVLKLTKDCITRNGATPAIYNTVPEYLGNRMPGTPRNLSTGDEDTSNEIEIRERAIATHEDQGPGAVMLDLANSSTHGLSRAEIIAQGVDPDDLLDDLNKYSAFIASENPAKQWVDVQPLVDNSDIYQCGFNLWWSYDRLDAFHYDGVVSQWLNAINGASALSEQQAPAHTNYVNGTYQARENAITTHAGCVYDDNTYETQTIAHLISNKYNKAMMDMFVFVGAMPFNQAQLVSEDLRAAMPYQAIDNRWRSGQDESGTECDPGYRTLFNHVRAYREVATTGWVYANGEQWGPDTEKRLIISAKAVGAQVKVGDVLAYAVNVGNDASLADQWAYIMERGVLKGIMDLILQSASVINIVATVAGYWYPENTGVRVPKETIIGRIETKSILGRNIPFGRLFLLNKCNKRPTNLAAAAVPPEMPIMVADLYDTLANQLNLSTASGARNLMAMRKWMFDPAYGPVLPITRTDLISGYTNRIDPENTMCAPVPTGASATQADLDRRNEQVAYLQVYSWLPPATAAYNNPQLKEYSFIPPRWGTNALSAQETAAHRWSRRIARITLDPTYIDGYAWLKKNTTEIRFIDYQDLRQDMALLQTSETRITCANTGHLPSIYEFLKNLDASKGDEGIAFASAQGLETATYVAKPQDKNKYSKPDSAPHFQYRDQSSTKGQFSVLKPSESSSTTTDTRRHSKRRHKKGNRAPKSDTLKEMDNGVSFTAESTAERGSASPDDKQRTADAINKAVDPLKVVGSAPTA